MDKNFNVTLEERDTLHLKVCHILREAILKGEFEPGERLVQEELAKALKVSRMPIREALRKLEAEGLLTIEPHRGAVVKGFHIEDIIEIYELRAQFERMAVEQSVERMSEEDIAKLEELVLKMDGITDTEEFVEANIAFHKTLVKGCSWNRLLTFIGTLWNGFPQQTPHIITGQLITSKKEHKEILEAVKQKDAKKAAQLLAEHVQRTGRELVKKMKENEGD